MHFLKTIFIKKNAYVFFTTDTCVRKLIKDDKSPTKWNYEIVAGAKDKIGYFEGALPGTMQTPLGITHMNDGSLIVVDGNGLVKITLK